MPRADGRPTIQELLDESEDQPMGPRDGKSWPPEEDCPGCPCHKDGPHKFSCAYAGARQLAVPARMIGGRMTIKLPDRRCVACGYFPEQDPEEEEQHRKEMRQNKAKEWLCSDCPDEVDD